MPAQSPIVTCHLTVANKNARRELYVSATSERQEMQVAATDTTKKEESEIEHSMLRLARRMKTTVASMAISPMTLHRLKSI